MGCDMSFLKKTSLARKGEDGRTLEEKRVLLLGLDNAGKTTLLFQLKDNEFKETVPTVGLNIEHVNYKGFSLTFWDVGGQATKLWKHYFDHIDGVAFVVDSTDDTRLMFAREELARLIRDENLGRVPFLVLFNKIDQVGKCFSTEELVSRLEIEQLKQEREMAVASVSAFSGVGLWEAMD